MIDEDYEDYSLCHDIFTDKWPGKSAIVCALGIIAFMLACTSMALQYKKTGTLFPPEQTATITEEVSNNEN